MYICIISTANPETKWDQSAVGVLFLLRFLPWTKWWCWGWGSQAYLKGVGSTVIPVKENAGSLFQGGCGPWCVGWKWDTYWGEELAPPVPLLIPLTSALCSQRGVKGRRAWSQGGSKRFTKCSKGSERLDCQSYNLDVSQAPDGECKPGQANRGLKTEKNSEILSLYSTFVHAAQNYRDSTIEKLLYSVMWESVWGLKHKT